MKFEKTSNYIDKNATMYFDVKYNDSESEGVGQVTQIVWDADVEGDG